MDSLGLLVLALYVDDILLLSASTTLLPQAKQLLHQEFDMTDLGKVSHFLGIHVDYNLETGTLKLSQKAYILLKLARFNLSTAASKETPMEDVAALESPFAVTMLDNMPTVTKNFSQLFPSASPEAEDLLHKLLHFNPVKRLTAEEASRHPYLAQFHNSAEESICTRIVRLPIDDNRKFTISEYRERLYQEIVQRKKEIRKKLRDKERLERDIPSKSQRRPKSRSECVKRVPEEKKDSLVIQKPQTVSPPQRLLSSASVTSQIANERIKREEQSWLKRAGWRLKGICCSSDDL
ncbi:hypothetical protein R1flu_010086 [Riccia fluitans]|uniref:Reverse transcriptase Ty1/copia-type domain-containing protein n=1 Tax=Riccia fluitans TaxID=41844 RepID=A0ABD1Z6I9_9MARC